MKIPLLYGAIPSPVIMPPMELRQLSEFSLIESLTRLVTQGGVATSPGNASFPIIVGVGDDTAAWRTQNAIELSTTDTVVEGVHFTRETTSWQDLGWKVMAANLSDIAAMGGTPYYALVTLGLPESTLVGNIESLYHGIIEICQEYQTAIVGGDVVRSPVMFVSVALNGVHDGKPMLRSAANPGDLLAVTGPLGSARGGLELLTNQPHTNAEGAEYLRQAHRRPQPRLREGRILLEEGVVAAMDISDGLVDDLAKMMTASGLAAHLDSWHIPIHSSLQQNFQERAVHLALAGGEEYELLYTAPPTVMERTLARIPNATAIGRVVSGPPGKVHIQDQEGNQLQGLESGWDHFRP